MHKQRLLDVITAIQNRDSVVFNMSTWASMNCQTSACAIGCYCLANPEAELKLNHTFTDGEVKYFRPSYKQFAWYGACAAYFQIELSQARYLFDPNYYHSQFCFFKPSVEDVISRIEKFIKDN